MNNAYYLLQEPAARGVNDKSQNDNLAVVPAALASLSNKATPRVQLPPFRHLVQAIDQASASAGPYHVSAYGIPENNYVFGSNNTPKQQLPSSREATWLSLSREIDFYNQLYYCLHENNLVSLHLSYLNAKFHTIFANIDAHRLGQSGELPISKKQFASLLSEIPDQVLNDTLASTESLLNLLVTLRARKFESAATTLAPTPSPAAGALMPISPSSAGSPPNRPIAPDLAIVRKRINAKPKKIKMLAPTGANSSVKQPKKWHQEISGLSKYRAFAPKCKHCTSTQTPEWRKGPDGARTLCNACGLFYSKIVSKYGAKDAAKIMAYKVAFKFQTDRVVPTVFEKDKMVRYVNSYT